MFKNFRLTNFRNANFEYHFLSLALQWQVSYNGCEIPFNIASYSAVNTVQRSPKPPEFYSGTREWVVKGSGFCGLIRNHLHTYGNFRDFNAFACLLTTWEFFEQQLISFSGMKNVFLQFSQMAIQKNSLLKIPVRSTTFSDPTPEKFKAINNRASPLLLIQNEKVGHFILT